MIHDKSIEMKKLLIDIETQLGKDLELANVLIERYGKLQRDARYYSLKATFLYFKGDINEGIEILKKGLELHPFNFDIHFNLGFLLGETQDYIIGIKHYLKSSRYANNEEDRKNGNENFERLIKLLYKNEYPNIKDVIEDVKNEVFCEDGRNYPLHGGRSLIRNVINYEKEKSYLVNMYKSFQVINVDNKNRFYFKTELIDGKKVDAYYSFISKASFILPISLIDSDTEFSITFNNETTSFEKNTFSINKYHYLKFNLPGELIIKTNKSIFLGNPIYQKLVDTKPKLVLKIFVDGLAYNVLENDSLGKIMPNTALFFKNGFIAKNCFINSEWTLPSKASINTGKYATKHRLLHPEYNYNFEETNKLLAEFFQEAGFYTTRIDTNWRTTAGFGYFKGFDRLIYQNFLGGMDCKDVIMEAIEHISAFKETNNFLTISMMDLHNVPDEIENHLFSEVNTDIKFKKNNFKKGPTSVLTKYDEVKIYKYKQEIKRLDIFLGVLFDFINKNYNEDEYVVLLHSDHGQTFLDKEDTLHHDSRLKVPFMMKGKKVPSNTSDEIIETVDILPSMLHYSNIDHPKDIDGKLPKTLGGKKERSFAFTQIIHPDQPYKGIITEKNYTFILETVKSVKQDLTIPFGEYSLKYINKTTKIDESNLYLEKMDIFESYIFDHISKFIHWED